MQKGRLYGDAVRRGAQGGCGGSWMAAERVVIFDGRCQPGLQEASRPVAIMAFVAPTGCQADTTPGVEWTPTPRHADTPLVPC